MSNSISVLIGAGFSAPMGYPTANVLNAKLLSCHNDVFAFHTDGTLVVGSNGRKPDFGYKTSYDTAFDFLVILMKYFESISKQFDYEKFFDFLQNGASDDPGVIEKYTSFEKSELYNLQDRLFTIKKIFPQIILYYLVDVNGDRWYDNQPHAGKPYFPGYTGILNCFERLMQNGILNVHTLNHDLFFERFNKSDWIAGNLCDGFEELGSPYYGDLSVNEHHYNCRLEYYTGHYTKPVRLFKLHGSRDYGLFYQSDGSILMPDQYIKTRFGIGVSSLLREINRDGDYFYDTCWINYHADFLTGTNSKIDRYKEPLLFQILFDHFANNLRTADKLVIVGYGAKDSEINKLLVENFDWNSKITYIIDPYPQEDLVKLRGLLNARLIVKQLEDIAFDDLEI